MIQRATVCLEPGVSHFFRQIEKPTRSRRVLHPSFWLHYGIEHSSTSNWWPQYLQDIRNVSIDRERARVTPSNASEQVSDHLDRPRRIQVISAGQSQGRKFANDTGHVQHSGQSVRQNSSFSRSNRDQNPPEPMWLKKQGTHVLKLAS